MLSARNCVHYNDDREDAKIANLIASTAAFFMPSIMEDVRATLETHMK
jgi:hypothetical protein